MQSVPINIVVMTWAILSIILLLFKSIKRLGSFFPCHQTLMASVALVCSVLWLKPGALPQSKHIVLNWKERRHALQSPTPLRVRTEKKKEREAKREGTFPCPLLHGWRVTVHRRKQDPVSGLDNKAKRPEPGGRKRADSAILRECVFLCVHACLHLSPHETSCSMCNTTAF